MAKEKANKDVIESELEAMEEVLEIRYITPKNAVFKENKSGFLSVEFEGETYDRINIYLTLPFSAPTEYISVRSSEKKAKEIGIIKDLRDFSEDVKAMINKQISLRYFTPIITKIYDIKDEFGYTYFDVETDKGRCKFITHMRSSSIVMLSESRILFNDIDENRFEIPDINKLSALEVKKLDMYI